MTPLTERALVLVKLAGSAAALARVAGVSAPSVSDWISGKTLSIKARNAALIAQKWGLNPLWVSDGLGEKFITDNQHTNVHEESATPHENDYALIPQFTANGSCGTGYYNDHVEIRGGLAFKRDWLARMGINPLDASIIHARGDSMSPTINDGEALMIDHRATDVQSGKVYLTETGGELRIKRLFKRANGWVVASDNQDKIRYPDEPLNALNDIRIIGRIVWRGGRL